MPVTITHRTYETVFESTSPQLIPTQLAPASFQLVATSHHVCARSNTTGITVPKVQLTALSSPIPTSSTPPAILPNLTTVQFVISSAPPLPFHYQIPTGYQLSTTITFPLPDTYWISAQHHHYLSITRYLLDISSLLSSLLGHPLLWSLFLPTLGLL